MTTGFSFQFAYFFFKGLYPFFLMIFLPQDTLENLQMSFELYQTVLKNLYIYDFLLAANINTYTIYR